MRKNKITRQNIGEAEHFNPFPKCKRNNFSPCIVLTGEWV